MNALSKIKDTARSKKRTVVLPEGTEPRTVQAAKKIVAEEIAKVIILGDEKEIERLAKEHGANLAKMEVVNPQHSPDFNGYVADFVELHTLPFKNTLVLAGKDIGNHTRGSYLNPLNLFKNLFWNHNL